MGFFCYSSDVLLQLWVATSRGVPGGLRFERILRSGGSRIGGLVAIRPYIVTVCLYLGNFPARI